MTNLNVRFANRKDLDLYYEWANEDYVRAQSYNSQKISYEDHIKWFDKKINSETTSMYIFHTKEGQAVGQVRIEIQETETIIGISIDPNFRGKSLGSKMLIIATNEFLTRHPDQNITAYIKKDNLPSVKIFEKAGFTDKLEVNLNNTESYKLIKTRNNEDR